MSEDQRLWVIITPVYRPAPGGGAVYSDILARALAATGETVLALAERFPGVPDTQEFTVGDGKVTVRRIFPFRAGRDRKDLRSYLSYMAQNLKMLAIPDIIRAECGKNNLGSVIVLLHSSFFYRPGIMPLVLKSLRRSAEDGALLIVDVRDEVFTHKHGKIFGRFDGAIGCSLAVVDKLRAILPEDVGVRHIPVPISPIEVPSSETIAKALQTYGLTGTRYLFNPNGILKGKNFSLMLDTTYAIREIPGYEDVELVTIGRAYDYGEKERAAEKSGVLRYLGSVPNEASIALAAGGLATIVLSPMGGLPRSAIESISIGKCVLVPDYREFRENIPTHIAKTDDPRDLARQLVALFSDNQVSKYPTRMHGMDYLVGLYKDLAAIRSS